MSDCSDDTPFLDETWDAAAQVLDPTLRAKRGANGRKKNVPARHASLAMGSQRGKNWSEGDFLLLLKAYGWMEENKKSTTTSKGGRLMKGWEAKAILETRMYEYWMGLEPQETRSQKSVMACWNQMVSIFKFVDSFNEHKIAGWPNLF